MTAPSTTRNPGPNDRPTAERTALSSEVSHFLVQLSIALHKTATYPAGHAALRSSIQALTLRLDQLLSNRQSINIGVERDRLLVGGGSTDPSNAVLRSLAEALHRHRIGMITLNRGASPAEVATLLASLAGDARQVEPLATREGSVLEQWPHIEITAVAPEQIEPATDGSGDPLETLWLSLSAATMRADPDVAVKPADLAAALRRHVRDDFYDRVIADYLARLGQELARSGGRDSAAAERLGDLILNAGNDTLGQLLRLGTDPGSRNQLVRDLTRVLPARSAIALTAAAADASARPISHPLSRLLGKLASTAEAQDGPGSVAADSALRDAITSLVDGWTNETPDPGACRDVLRELSATWRTETGEIAQPGTDAMRLVDISLEANAVGPAILRALNELVSRGRLDDILESLGTARESDAARQIRAHLARPEQILVLLESRQSRRAVGQLLSWADAGAAGALLDGLEAADSRGTRRQIIARLVELGDEIGPRIVDRLNRGPWYVQRNMLHLLSEMDRIPEGFQAAAWLDHEDPRVRREAVRVALLVPEARDRAIELGLRQDDARIQQLALNVALEKCPPGLTDALISLLDDPATPDSIRASAVRLLGRTRTAAARAWLVNRVLVYRGWWRRPALAPKNPEFLIAISALRHWSSNREAALALSLARQSADVETRFAATDSTGDWP